MKEPEEIIYDKFHIFYENESRIISIDPRSFNHYRREGYKLLGKCFADLIKELKAKSSK